MNYFDWIGKWSVYTPDKIAVASADTGKSYTYKELHELSLKLGNLLRQKYSIHKGDRIAVLATHSRRIFNSFYSRPKNGSYFSSTKLSLFGFRTSVLC